MPIPRTRDAAAPLAALLILLQTACSEGAPALVDTTRASGIEFLHESGFRDTYYFPEVMGSGLALVDVDADGALDVYALQGGVLPGSPHDVPRHEVPSGEGSGEARRPMNRLWRGRGDGTFEEVTATSGDAAHSGYAMGVAAGDIDGDALVDLLVTNFGPDALLANRGGGRFEEITAGTTLAEARWSTAAGFADLDRDGHLDLVVCGYVLESLGIWGPCVIDGIPDYCDVSQFEGLGDRAWRGDGRGGFEERTAAWGLAGRRGKGLGLALVDLDDDGDVDIYVANDSEANHMLRNRGDAVFEDESFASGAAYNIEGKAEAGMGVAVGDVDGDLRPDLVVTNFAGESNSLYTSAGGGRFRDRSRSSGLTAVSRTPLGFGVIFSDLDQDGLEDLVVTNGHVLRHVGERFALWTHAQSAQLLHASGGGRFEPWEPGPALLGPRVGRGLAAGDLDGDGDPDLVLTGSDEELLVLTNEMALPGSHWLAVELRGRGSNTLAIGARVVLRLAGGNAQVRWIRSGTSYLSQDELVARFGFPPGSSPLEIEVRWPDGAESRHSMSVGNAGNAGNAGRTAGGMDRRVRIVQPTP